MVWIASDRTHGDIQHRKKREYTKLMHRKRILGTVAFMFGQTIISNKICNENRYDIIKTREYGRTFDQIFFDRSLSRKQCIPQQPSGIK